MFDWSTNLDLAEELGAGAYGTGAIGGMATVQVTKATYRCAVGRAYYAAFGHARQYAVRHLGFSITGTPADHGRLVQHFGSMGLHSIAILLRSLRQARNQCDYDNHVPRLNRMVRMALRDANAIIGQL